MTFTNGGLDSLDLEVWTKFAREGLYGVSGYTDCLILNHCSTPLSTLQEMMNEVYENLELNGNPPTVYPLPGSK